MNDFLQLCFAGLALGSRYALVALGFVVIYKATGVINFAQGALVTLGAYLAYNFHQTWGLPFPVALVMAVVGGALVLPVREQPVRSRALGADRHVLRVVELVALNAQVRVPGQ